MILRDLEWLSKIFNDMKRRAVSLQQLSFLSFIVDLHFAINMVVTIINIVFMANKLCCCCVPSASSNQDSQRNLLSALDVGWSWHNGEGWDGKETPVNQLIRKSEIYHLAYSEWPVVYETKDRRQNARQHVNLMIQVQVLHMSRIPVDTYLSEKHRSVCVTTHRDLDFLRHINTLTYLLTTYHTLSRNQLGQLLTI